MKGYYYLKGYFNDLQVLQMIGNGPEDTIDNAPDKHGRAWGQATIRGEDRQGTIDPSIRNVDIYGVGSMMMPDLTRSLGFIFRQINAKYFGFDIFDVFQIDMLRYRGGVEGSDDMFYNWHIDTDYWSNQNIQRKITMIIQLSDEHDYEGGDLEFQSNKILEGHNFREKGSVIMFPSPWSHRITPVTKGTRRSIVAWAEGPAWR